MITETAVVPNLSENGWSDFSATASSLNLRKILFKIYSFSLVSLLREGVVWLNVAELRK